MSEDNTKLYRPGMTGCSDANCIFQDNSKGMHTNGGCSCEKELKRHPQGFKAAQTIHYLRGNLRADTCIDKDEQLKAAERLCKIYFDIASTALGEARVRKLRDKALLTATQEPEE